MECGVWSVGVWMWRLWSLFTVNTVRRDGNETGRRDPTIARSFVTATPICTYMVRFPNTLTLWYRFHTRYAKFAPTNIYLILGLPTRTWQSTADRPKAFVGLTLFYLAVKGTLSLASFAFSSSLYMCVTVNHAQFRR
jgi:hypothetical protein